MVIKCDSNNLCTAFVHKIPGRSLFNSAFYNIDFSSSFEYYAALVAHNTDDMLNTIISKLWGMCCTMHKRWLKNTPPDKMQLPHNHVCLIPKFFPTYGRDPATLF